MHIATVEDPGFLGAQNVNPKIYVGIENTEALEKQPEQDIRIVVQKRMARSKV